MATSASIAGWLEVLSRLDRHGARRHSSPDVAGLVELMGLYRVPGLSIAVEQDGERSWTAGYGTVAADAPTPVGPQTVFQACSISKHVAASTDTDHAAGVARAGAGEHSPGAGQPAAGQPLPILRQPLCGPAATPD